MKTATTNEVRQALIDRREIALFDVRDEAVFAEAHPLFAASLPLGRLELDIQDRVRRRQRQSSSTMRARPRLRKRRPDSRRSATRMSRFAKRAWRAGARPAPRSFATSTPRARRSGSWSRQLTRLRFRRRGPRPHRAPCRPRGARCSPTLRVPTMSIPTAVSVPGADLLPGHVRLRSPRDPRRWLSLTAPDGHAASIGTQSLGERGNTANRVAALRNGTIGWLLAGLDARSSTARSERRPPSTRMQQRVHGRPRAT